MTTEAWRPVSQYEGLYEVSNFGRVRRVAGGRGAGKGKCLKIGKHSRGYGSVVLTKNGKQHNHYVHRLVALAFLLLDSVAPEVNHKNGNKRDNRVENLEWVTRKQNVCHARDVLGYKFGPKKQAGAVGYIHLLNGRVAVYTPNEQVCYAGNSVAVAVDYKQIRREQYRSKAWRKKNGYSNAEDVYGHLRVLL